MLAITRRLSLWCSVALFVAIPVSKAFPSSGAFWIDQVPPPALAAFTITSALDAAQSVRVTVTLPSSTADYNRVELRYLLGATAPAAACNNGTVFKTYNAGGFVSETFNHAIAASTAYSFRACIYDVQGNLTSSNVQTSVTTSMACAGAMVGGHCWYLAAVSQNCDDRCAAAGSTGNLAATRDYSGSNGTAANCQAVMNAIGGPGTAVEDSNCVVAAGCTYDSFAGYNNRRRCQNITTNMTSGNFTTQRACACNG